MSLCEGIVSATAEIETNKMFCCLSWLVTTKTQIYMEEMALGHGVRELSSVRH